MKELGVPDLDLREMARNIPLAVLRVLDLARALAIEPDDLDVTVEMVWAFE